MTDSNYVQGLTWSMKREHLERMIQEMDGRYTHLQFKLVVDEKCVTRYFIALATVDEKGSTQETVQHKICPSPPDCPDEN